MSSVLDRITTVEVGMPGPSGAGITTSEKTSITNRLTTLEAGASVAVQDEGVALATNASTLNFVGAGVTASGTGATKTVTIPGGTLTVQEEEVTVATGVTTLDFTGIDFNLSESPAGEINISRNRPATIFRSQSKDTAFSSITTSFTDVDSVTIGPLSDGIAYDIELEVVLRGGPDSTGFLTACARIGSDSTQTGTKTGTVAGERTVVATATRSNHVGDGVSTITLFARAQMDTGTGTVASSHIRARAIPR